MRSWEVEGLSIDDKYEIEEFSDIMKNFADAATQGDLEQVETILETGDSSMLNSKVKHGLSIGAEINSLGEKWTGKFAHLLQTF